MDRLKALQIFSAVVRHGSFVRGAEALQLSKPSTTRAVQDLEALLGVRLLQRSTRSLSLTSAGADVLARATALLASFEELAAVSSLSASEVGGTVRLAAPTAYGARRLAGPLTAFAARYPRARIEMHATDEAFDLVEDRIDLGVWVGRDVPQCLIARQVGVEPVGLFAAPDYLARCGMPADPAELGQWEVLHDTGAGLQGTCRFHRAGREVRALPPRSALCSNNEELQVAAAVHGAGLLRLPVCLVERELATGRLVPVLAQWQLEPLAVRLAYSSRRSQPLVVRRMIEHLAASLG